MKRLIMDEDSDTIRFSDINENDPIFAKQDGVLKGIVAHELSRGWILRTGGSVGATGHHPTLEGCIKSGLPHGYEFFVGQRF